MSHTFFGAAPQFILCPKQARFLLIGCPSHTEEFKQHVGRVSGLTAREVYPREKKLPNKIKNRTTDPLKVVMTLQNATQLKKAPRNLHIHIQEAPLQ